MSDRIQYRRGTAAIWTSTNPTPAQGEPCLETDTGFTKMGDGSTAWNDLDYWTDDSGGGGSGSVTTVSVASANGFAGTVTNPTSTPAVTLKTTVEGLLKGDSTTGVVSAASAGTDYLAPGGSGAALTGITAAQVGADAAGAAATAQTNAETYADNKLSISGNLADLDDATEARSNLGLGTAATHASTDFDAAGAASTAQTTAEAASVSKSGDVMNGSLSPKVVALTDGSSVALDASLANIFSWTLGAGSHTLSTPTNPVDGKSIKIRIKYSGSYTPLFTAGVFDFGTAGQPSWSATSGKTDEVGFEYNAALNAAAGAWAYMGSALGQTS